MRNDSIWHDPPQRPVDPALQRAIGGHPLVSRLLVQRGYGTLDAARAFLDPGHYTPAPPDDLPDLPAAVEHLERALTRGAPILIWGDFDVDGQTSTALLLDALRRVGAHVNFYIPNRLRESHGIRLDSLRAQLDRFPAQVLLTCDTGVSEFESLDYAKSNDLTVLVTDHHDLPPRLPDVDAIVNPKRLPPEHPLAALPGVGVAYKLVEALYTRLGRAAELPGFLDLVALGIVVDVAHQTRDTRYLLQRGLEQLRHTARIGLHTLYQSAGLEPATLTATAIAFQLGPRLNAAGRLDDAAPVVELLTTADSGRAEILAAQLEGLNNARQLQSRQTYTGAQEQIARDPSVLDWEALVLSSPNWHPGIIGLVASRLAEFYARPAVLLALAGDGAARGSARSAPGYDIGAAIAAQADLLHSHGGHPGAAGLALDADAIPAFRRRLSETLRATRDPSIQPGVAIDAYVEWSALSLELARELDRLAPFGEGNPPLTLAARDLHLRSAALMGRTQEHRRLTVEDAAGHRQTVLWWRGAESPLPDSLFDLAFRPSVSTFKGAPELQLELVAFRRAAAAPPAEIAPPRREVIDRRGTPDPRAALAELLQEYPSAAVWAEGYRREDSPGVTLSALDPTPTLLVYTTPSGPGALQNALERAQPERVILLAVDPPIRTPDALQRRVMELAKFVIRHREGRTSLGELAGAIGHAPATIAAALELSAAHGDLVVRWRPDDSVILTPGDGAPTGTVPARLAAFQAAVTETAAYRAFVRRADPHQILGWTDEQ